MKTIVLLASLALGALMLTQSSAPEVESWMRNTSGQTGYGGLPANVQMVRYSEQNVYINSSGIPSYTIGPWPGNPSTPANKNYLFRIPRTALANTGAPEMTPLGQVGILLNGVPLYNPLDGRSYQNQNIWHNNVGGSNHGVDSCSGHPNAQSQYHVHFNPTCLYTPNAAQHSPLIGYAFDGYPIYGSYAYANVDGSGGIKRMASSYQLRNITQRTTLPDGTALSPGQYGPAVGGSYPLGYFVEDYEFVGGMGDLDFYNGRFAVTPEYPDGTYAYYASIDQAGNSAYPYLLGLEYYGLPARDNQGPSTSVTVTGTVTVYDGTPLPTPNRTPTSTEQGTPISLPHRGYLPLLGQ